MLPGPLYILHTQLKWVPFCETFHVTLDEAGPPSSVPGKTLYIISTNNLILTSIMIGVNKGCPYKLKVASLDTQLTSTHLYALDLTYGSTPLSCDEWSSQPTR